jgi:HIV Tat-specific factor 1
MNGRFFAGRKVEASLYSDKQRFKRGDVVEDGLDGANDAAEKQRLDDFAKWLMTEGD